MLYISRTKKNRMATLVESCVRQAAHNKPARTLMNNYLYNVNGKKQCEYFSS